MATVNEVYGFLDKLAPFDLQMDFDNAGFLVGRGETRVKRLLVALDITLPVAEEAAEKGCQLIVSHHPVIFHPVKALTDQNATGRVLLALAEGHMAAICAHTNLDAVMGGVNCCLARTLDLKELEQLQQNGIDNWHGPSARHDGGGVRRLCEGEAGGGLGALCRRGKTRPPCGGGWRLLRLYAL